MSTKKYLYFGDCLDVLRSNVKDESVDLIYLDPPFNSSENYNILFRSPKTEEQSHAQIQAFVDTWRWGIESQKEYEDIVKGTNSNLSELMQALRECGT
jgi:DNA modification methylase